MRRAYVSIYNHMVLSIDPPPSPNPPIGYLCPPASVESARQVGDRLLELIAKSGLTSNMRVNE